MYQPNFCAECGAKQLRLRWRLWTSRRFCNDCARHLRRARLGPAVMVALTLFGAGFMFGRIRRPSAPTLVIERRADSPLSDGEANHSNTSRRNSTVAPDAAKELVTEDIYACGARTQKGTPCSRRVHGPVRCWQHKGMPAMLPQGKLLVKE